MTRLQVMVGNGVGALALVGYHIAAPSSGVPNWPRIIGAMFVWLGGWGLGLVIARLWERA